MLSDSISQRSLRCLLVGNYGAGNIGDEALREYFLSAFPEVQWTIVSGKLKVESGKWKVVPRLPLGLRSFFRAWWKTLSAIRDSDAIVFGGGSLFTDIESVWACIMWRCYAVMAVFFGKPYFLAFQGAGPFRTALGERLARKTYEGAAFISVRDSASRKRVEAWRVKVPVIETFDPAFALFQKYSSASEGSTLVLIPRGNSDDAFFVSASGEIAKTWNRISILLLEPNAAEREAAKRLNAMAHGKAAVIEIRSLQQLLSEVSKATTVVAQRYHGALAALAMAKKTIICPQSPGDKLDSLRLLQSDALARQKLVLAVGAGEDALRQALSRFGKR